MGGPQAHVELKTPCSGSMHYERAPRFRRSILQTEDLRFARKDNRNEGTMHRILSETILLSPTNERNYELTVRIAPIIPSLSGRHFAASPHRLVSVCDRAAIPTFKLRESYGITEEGAVRGCVEKVTQFLTEEKRSKRGSS
jgi:hypothetical protein